MDQSFSLAYVLQLLVTKLHAVAFFFFFQGLGHKRFDTFGSSGVHIHVQRTCHDVMNLGRDTCPICK